jgi:hypothetical protein
MRPAREGPPVGKPVTSPETMTMQSSSLNGRETHVQAWKLRFHVSVPLNERHSYVRRVRFKCVERPEDALVEESD